MHPRELNNKRVLVVGFGVTGASVARFLKKHDVAFDVADQRDSAALASLAASLDCGVTNQFDGETFSAYDVLVLSPGIPRSQPAITQSIAAGTDVIGDIELFAGVVDVPVIGVTGSNGKSTVVSWTASALCGAGINAVACGNIGVSALDSLELEADVYVLELSSYQLESTRSLTLLSAAVLNVSDDHLDRYDDIDQYAAVKRSVLDHASRCVVNQDDKRTWPATGPCEYFTLESNAEQHSRWHRAVKDGEVWLCDDQYPVLAQSELNVPGDHNVANALAVLALIEPLEVPFTAVRDGLIKFTGLPHRSQYLGERHGVRWYNDSKGTNIDACAKAVQAMSAPVILIAGGISKGADFEQLRPVVKQHVRLLVLMGQDRTRISEQLAGTVEMIMVEDLRQAVSVCEKQAQTGDAVLLSPACSSFDMFKNFEDRGEQFTAAVEEVLAA